MATNIAWPEGGADGKLLRVGEIICNPIYEPVAPVFELIGCHKNFLNGNVPNALL